MIMPMAMKRSGFTLVELTIVMFVIAVLAATTYVSYNGLQQRSYDVAVLSDSEAIHASLESLSMGNSGILDLNETGYFYSEEAYANSDEEGKERLQELLNQLEFTPTKGSAVDVRILEDGREYCIRVYNPKASKFTNAFNAYTVSSSENVVSDVDGDTGTPSCEYKEGRSPTVYAGGAIPGAYETLYDANDTYFWPDQATRVEVAVIGAGGNGNGNCGGSGGGVSTAVIERSSNAGPFNIVVGQPSNTIGTDSGRDSRFGTIVGGGGQRPANGCRSLLSGTPGGNGTTTGGVSQRYGSGMQGGLGGSWGLLGFAVGATGTGTGGGGAGAASLLQGGQAGAGVTTGIGGGGGGGGGGVYGLLICVGQGPGGNPGGMPGGPCSGTNQRNGGNGSIGGGGGGTGNGGTPGTGGSGQVKVLTCFESTCSPIATPAP